MLYRTLAVALISVSPALTGNVGSVPKYIKPFCIFYHVAEVHDSNKQKKIKRNRYIE